MDDKQSNYTQQIFDNLKSHNNKLELETRLNLAESIIDELLIPLHQTASKSA